MLVAFPFSSRDQSLALANLQWIAELGSQNHDIILFVDDDVDAMKELAAASKCFRSAKVVKLDKCETTKWPIVQNHVWRRIVDYIDFHKLYPFFMQEDDAIILHRDSYDQIESEYKRCGKPFMGYLEYAGDKERQHQNGVGMYRDIYELAPLLMAAPTEDNGKNYMAWDWSGGPEVVPQMHVSRLIQFAYKKEAELLKDETLSWLNPDAAVFHTCKDVRIFDMLRKRIKGECVSGQNVSASRDTQEPKGRIKTPPDWPEGSTPSSPTLTCDIFIKTYDKVSDWHACAMRSIEKYATGFRRTVVVGQQPIESYRAMQVHKLTADQRTDADYILTTDSDCIFSTQVNPRTFMRHGKTIWLHRSWESAVKQEGDAVLRWRIGMKNFMGVDPQREFMCRHPEMLPRWIYAAFRMFCFERHGKTLEQWILADKDFADWNVLGHYAWTFHREAFYWIDQDREEPPPMTLKQFWGGHEPIDPRRTEIEAILAGGIVVLHQPPGPIQRLVESIQTAPVKKQRRGKRMKRAMSPEHKAKLVESLELARASKLAKA